MERDEPTNPGGPVSATPLDEAMLRIDRRLAGIHRIAAETYNEVVALRPRVDSTEREVQALKARVLLLEQDNERLRSRVSMVEGRRNPTPPSRPEGT